LQFLRSNLEIDKDNVKELEGKQVGVPIGTAAHYGFLKQMQHFGVNTSTMKIVDMAPADGAAAFATGNLDMVCGWGGALRRMKEHGNVLMSGTEKEKLGIQVFDATKSDDMLNVIAKAAGMNAKTTKDTMKGFSFPTTNEQLSDKWLGGGTQKFLKEVADFFVAQGIIPKARKSYDDAVDASYLEAAAKL